MAALSIQNLTFGYANALIFNHLSLNVPQSTLAAIIGPNGTGKSTLLKLVSGFLRPFSGSISILKNLKVCYLPQRSELDLTFPLLVEDVAGMGLWSKFGHFSSLSHDLKCQVTTALKLVGLEGYEKQSLNQLSGGQLQRLLFARLSMEEGDILLLDEPFAAIDQATVKDLMGLIQNWQLQGKTILVVVHNIDLVRKYFPKCMLLTHQKVIFDQTEDILTKENIAQALYNV